MRAARACAGVAAMLHVLARGEQPFHQEGRLDQIAAVIEHPEDGHGAAVDPSMKCGHAPW
jgi:hypothetical protein